LAAGIIAVSDVELTYVVAMFVPAHCAIELLVKFVPVIVTEVSPEPTVAVVIDRDVMLGVEGEVEFLLPPQPAVITNNKANNAHVATEKRCCISLPTLYPASGNSP
jgi:hypothetical protein